MSVNLQQCWQADGCSAQRVCVRAHTRVCVHFMCMLVFVFRDEHLSEKTDRRVKGEMNVRRGELQLVSVCFTSVETTLICVQYVTTMCVYVLQCVGFLSCSLRCNCCIWIRWSGLPQFTPTGVLSTVGKQHQLKCACEHVCVVWEKCVFSSDKGTIQPFFLHPLSHIKPSDHH